MLVDRSEPRFLSSPLTIRVPFFLKFGFSKETLKLKGPQGTTQEPRNREVSLRVWKEVLGSESRV